MHGIFVYHLITPSAVLHTCSIHWSLYNTILQPVTVFMTLLDATTLTPLKWQSGQRSEMNLVSTATETRLLWRTNVSSRVSALWL